MEADDGVKMVLVHHFHFHAPQQLSHHDVFVDPLSFAERVAHIVHLFPIFERSPLVIAPKL